MGLHCLGSRVKEKAQKIIENRVIKQFPPPGPLAAVSSLLTFIHLHVLCFVHQLNIQCSQMLIRLKKSLMNCPLLSFPKSGLGKRSYQKNATFLHSFTFFIKERGVLCVLRFL